MARRLKSEPQNLERIGTVSMVAIRGVFPIGPERSTRRPASAIHGRGLGHSRLRFADDNGGKRREPDAVRDHIKPRDGDGTIRRKDGMAARTIDADKVSLVMPVRDAEHQVTQRVESTLEKLEAIFGGPTELVIVDDGSTDSTTEVLDDLRLRYPQVRVVRHGRPRGLESAGQTGLERSTGDLIFILESDAEVRLADLQKLVALAEDDSIVAARAESESPAATSPLVRRLRLWADNADRQVVADTPNTAAVQMVRRPHLNRLSGPGGRSIRLRGETIRLRDTATL